MSHNMMAASAWDLVGAPIFQVYDLQYNRYDIFQVHILQLLEIKSYTYSDINNYLHDIFQVYLQLLLYSDIDEDDHIRLLSSSRHNLEDALAYLRQMVSGDGILVN